MATTHVRKGDTVVVMSGKDASAKAKGRVLSVNREKGRVLVEGINMVVKHMKKGKVRQSPTGQRMKMEASIAISNVALYCTKCERGVRYSVRRTAEGARQRVCKKCGAEIPLPQDKK